MDAWEDLGFIPRVTWMEYLRWFRKVLDIPVENETELLDIRSRDDGLLDLLLRQQGREETVLARHLVLATGRDGLGGGYMPDIFKNLPEAFRAHSEEAIDFTALKGRRVTVIGAGASAMDNAAEALEAGAARVDMLIRRKDIPRINKFTGIGSQGVVHGFQALPDSWKWRFLDYTLAAQTPPPRPSTLRVSKHPNAFFHLGCPVEAVAVEGEHLRVTTPRGVFETDFLIAATGFAVDIGQRPELKSIASSIRFWKDRFTPAAEDNPSGVLNPELELSPDLGPAFEFQPREGVDCPALEKFTASVFRQPCHTGRSAGISRLSVMARTGWQKELSAACLWKTGKSITAIWNSSTRQNFLGMNGRMSDSEALMRGAREKRLFVHAPRGYRGRRMVAFSRLSTGALIWSGHRPGYGLVCWPAC